MAHKPIQINVKTKERLDKKKLVKSESYDSIINRMLDNYSDKFDKED